ncbi:hypothetical protein ACNKHT_11610 [Shigella flexneri]
MPLGTSAAYEREMLLTNSAQHVTETECFISFPLTDIKIDANYLFRLKEMQTTSIKKVTQEA